jgi:hypothetical protein
MVYNFTLRGIFRKPEISLAIEPSTLLPVPRHSNFQREAWNALDSTISLQTNLPESMQYLVGLFKEELEIKCTKRSFSISLAPRGLIASIPPNMAEKVPHEEWALFASEGYYMEATSDYLMIAAESPKGIFYGITTLLQLIDEDGCYLEGVILDWPCMEIRGVSDENARGQAASIEGLKRYVRFLALLKMNMLQMNLEDMFASQVHPKSSDEERGCYTTEEIQDLCAYAAEYFVEVMPIQSTCGHLDNLFVLPEFKHLAEFENVSICFDLSNPNIYDYIKDIIEEEVNAWNKSVSFHMACDESWDVGKGRSKAFVDEKGLGMSYLDHYKKCYEIARDALESLHGKDNFRIFMYQDIMIHHPIVLEKLPRKNLVIDVWDYSKKEKYPAVNEILDASFEFIVSPSVMDYQRFLPSFSASEKNIINLITYGYKTAKAAGKSHLFKGETNTTWGDYRSENMRDLRMYGYALSATVAWNVEPWLAFSNKLYGQYKALGDFKKGFYKHVFGISDADAVLQLDRILHSVEGGKHFKPWLGLILLPPKLWTHPLHPLKKEKSKHFPEAIKEFESGIAICHEFRQDARQFQFFFDAISASLYLHVLYCKKVLLKEKLEKVNPAGLNEIKMVDLAKEVEALATGFLDAGEAYERLWDINNKPECKSFLLNQYQSLARFLTEIKEAIRNKDPAFSNPFIPSEYIYVPIRLPIDSPVVFSKKLTIAGSPVRVGLQAFAINHGEVAINGSTIGAVEFRPTLSYMILEHCVKTWDVTSIILEGENEISISVTNNTQTWPVLNVLLELLFDDGHTETFITDTTWTATLPDGLPVHVKSFGMPPSIIGGLTLPDFVYDRRSHFTRWLGLAVEVLARWPKSLEFFLPLVIRLALKAKITM